MTSLRCGSPESIGSIERVMETYASVGGGIRAKEERSRSTPIELKRCSKG